MFDVRVWGCVGVVSVSGAKDLRSSSSGLRYRRSPSHDDDAKVTKLKPVPWDSFVCGTLESDGAFLKLEDHGRRVA